MTAGLTSAELRKIGLEAGLSAVGVAPARILEPARSALHHRKAAGLAGDMQFTYRNPDRSSDPHQILPSARSMVAGALRYRSVGPPDGQGGVRSGPAGKVARYSWIDYYDELKGYLGVVADVLRDAGHRAVVVADSNATVDRNVAWSAGLGWYGKNSNLLLPASGSWFVLGAVVTDAELEPTGPPLEDGCGTCSRCIDDCPTAAIVAPGVVDARKCLAWIVQAAGSIPVEYREAVGDRLYGCDDCQEVCPPNQILDRTQASNPRESRPEDQREVDLVHLLTASNEEILEDHGRWYIPDRDVDFLRRTALVVLGNVATPRDRGVRELVIRYVNHSNPILRSHAVWCARRLGLTADLEAMENDRDDAVRQELTVPVTARFESTDWSR